MTETNTATARRTHVIGVYDSLDDARGAVEQLQREGVPIDDISIVGNLEKERTVHGFVTAEETAKEGVRLGATVGGLFGLLSGTAFFFVPGVGPLVVVGPLASALLGAGEGAVTGGLFGALLGKIMEAKRIPKYEEHVRNRKYLVVVRADPETVERLQEAVQGTAATEVETEAVAG
jgi:hypothetical protein